MSLHLITSLSDGQLSSTPLETIASQMNDVWVTDRTEADAHCRSKTSTAEQDLTNARAHLDRYGTARLNDVNTHCRNRENAGIANVNRHTDGKRAWVNQQLNGRMRKP